MRLTLRTLLAYMDGLLPPKDSQEIGKRVEDSPVATELFHKIRDVMRRLRLAAPGLNEKGANQDCNTVAEYLDNALPDDRLPDFEEVCLKSEIHLAEVASAHQILTMVLGEPATIDPESRERMYRLPTIAGRSDEERQAAAEAASLISSDGLAKQQAAQATNARPRPIVPEYLRGPTKPRRLLPAAAFMFVLGAAICLVLLLLGQFEKTAPLGKAMLWAQAKFQGPPKDKEDPEDRLNGGKNHKSELAKPADSGSTLKPRDSAVAIASKDSAAKDSATAPQSTEIAIGKAASDKPLAMPEKPSAASVPSVGPVGMPAKSGSAEVAIADKKTDITPEVKPVGTATEPAKMPIVVASVTPTPAVGKLPSEVSKVEPLTPPKPGASSDLPGETNPKAEESAKIGRFMSDGQDVLLKFQAADATWQRVLPEEFLLARQALLALPSYRPRMALLNVGATLELLGGTRIELLPENGRGQPGLGIDFGRVVVKPLAQAGAHVRLTAGTHSGVLTLNSVESTAAIEVSRLHDPGTDPEKIRSRAVTKLYVARGSVVWEEGNGRPPIRLNAPAEQLLDVPSDDMAKGDSGKGGANKGANIGSVKESPKWITTNAISDVDQRAALSVSQSLPANRSAMISLKELAQPEQRKREIRWLAARCLGYLGEFEPLVTALNDSNFRSEWPDYVDQIHEALARGPETAAAVRQAMEKQFSTDAPTLYRMLWGYTDRDLENEEDARLVKALDHEYTVFRVLAFSNLADITNLRLYYHPEYSTVKRQPSVQRWRQVLQQGKIRRSLAIDKGRPATEPPSATAEPDKRPAEPDKKSAEPEKKPAEPEAKADLPGAPDRVAVPEPEVPQKRPPVAVPEPAAGNEPQP